MNNVLTVFAIVAQETAVSYGNFDSELILTTISVNKALVLSKKNHWTKGYKQQ